MRLEAHTKKPRNHTHRYRRRIVPLLSLSVDFYVRVFVRVYTSPNEVKDSPSRLAYLWQSSGCDSFFLQVCVLRARVLRAHVFARVSARVRRLGFVYGRRGDPALQVEVVARGCLRLSTAYMHYKP